MSEKQETIADIVASLRAQANESEKRLGDQHTFVEEKRKFADRIEAAHKRERGFEISVIRAKLYGVAAGLHALAARSDARQRGISYTVVQEIAKQIENIADEGGKDVCAKCMDDDIVDTEEEV